MSAGIVWACAGQRVAEPAAERVMVLKHTAEARDVQAIATAVRAIAEIRDMSADATRRTITFRGSEEQIALAEWLVAELDRPPTAKPAPGMSPEFRMAGDDDPIVRVFYVREIAAIESFQEITTVMRSIAEIRRVFMYNARYAIALRGRAEQIALAEWLCGALDRAAHAQSTATPIYRVYSGRDDIARVFYVPRTESVADLQETATLIRSIAEIPRLFACRGPRAVAMRGTADQLAAANWLLTALERPTKKASEYAFSANGSERMHVFWLPNDDTPAHFQQVVTSVRAGSGIRRGFGHPTRRALVVRGTADQIAAAEQVVREAEKRESP